MLKIHNTALSPPNLIIAKNIYIFAYALLGLGDPQRSVDHTLRATALENSFRNILSDVISNGNVI